MGPAEPMPAGRQNQCRPARLVTEPVKFSTWLLRTAGAICGSNQYFGWAIHEHSLLESNFVRIIAQFCIFYRHIFDIFLVPDEELTFAQEVKVDGAIIVSTPQDLALLDVKRGIQMFDKTGVKILGLIDNMSFFKGDDGKEYNIFGDGGVEKTAKEFNKNFLGKIPIHQDLRDATDKGDPLTHSNPGHEVSMIFKNIAEKIKLAFQ